MRKLKRDTIISVVNGRDLVGVYFADTDGREALLECSPKIADKIIALWNEQFEVWHQRLEGRRGNIKR